MVEKEEVQVKQPGPNYLVMGLQVFAAIIVFNIVAAVIFYFFIAPHMH